MDPTVLTSSDRDFLLDRLPLWRMIPKSRKSRNVVNQFLNNVVAEYWEVQGNYRVMSDLGRDKISFRIRHFFHNKRVRQYVSQPQDKCEQSLTSHGSAMLDSTDLGHSQPVFEPETANISTATHKRTCQVFHDLPPIVTIEMDLSVPASPVHSQSDSQWSDEEIDELDD